MTGPGWNKEQNMTKHYELSFIVATSQEDEGNIQAVADGVKALLQEKGAEINWEDTLGKRKFTYQIDHNQFGFYFTFEFDIDQEVVPEIDREMRLNADVLRYLLVIREKRSIEVLQKEKEERERVIEKPEEERRGRQDRRKKPSDRSRGPAPSRIPLAGVPMKKEAKPEEAEVVAEEAEKLVVETDPAVEAAPVEEVAESPKAEEPKVEEAKKEVKEEVAKKAEKVVKEVIAEEVAVPEEKKEEAPTEEPKEETKKEEKKEAKEEEKVDLEDFSADKLDEILDKEIDI